MADLQALEREFHAACVAFIAASDADNAAECDARQPRVDNALKLINTRRPASLSDCIIKLRTLVDRKLGGDYIGDRDHDFGALRQVIAFLGA